MAGVVITAAKEEVRMDGRVKQTQNCHPGAFVCVQRETKSRRRGI